MGLTLEKTLADLGSAKRIEVGKENTTIIDGAGVAADIEARVKQIRIRSKEATSDYDREKAARARGQTGRRCGRDQGRRCHRSRNEGKKARVEDALHATRAAVEEGIVAGGGVWLCCAPDTYGDMIKGLTSTKVTTALQTPVPRRPLSHHLHEIESTPASRIQPLVVNAMLAARVAMGFNAANTGLLHPGPRKVSTLHGASPAVHGHLDPTVLLIAYRK